MADGPPTTDAASLLSGTPQRAGRRGSSLPDGPGRAGGRSRFELEFVGQGGRAEYARASCAGTGAALDYRPASGGFCATPGAGQERFGEPDPAGEWHGADFRRRRSPLPETTLGGSRLRVDPYEVLGTPGHRHLRTADRGLTRPLRGVIGSIRRLIDPCEMDRFRAVNPGHAGQLPVL